MGKCRPSNMLKPCLRTDPPSSPLLISVPRWDVKRAWGQILMEGFLEVRQVGSLPAESRSSLPFPSRLGIYMVLSGRAGVWGHRKGTSFPITGWVPVSISSKKRVSLEFKGAVWSDTGSDPNKGFTEGLQHLVEVRGFSQTDLSFSALGRQPSFCRPQFLHLRNGLSSNLQGCCK